MAGRKKEQREAAGRAADRRSLPRPARIAAALSAWLAGPVLVFGAVTLNSALADQHATQHFAAPRAAAPHFSAPHNQVPHFSAPRPPAQHGYGGPSRMPSPEPYRQFRAAPSFGDRSIGQPAPGRSFAPSIGSQRDFANERAYAAQPGRPFPPQNPPSRPLPGGRMSGGQPGNPQGNGEHLGSWMRQHQNQSLADQERALRQEQGFNRLAPQQQQNLVNRLHQLDQMPPAQRERTMQRVENMERLSPERRQAVRSSAQQLGALPQERKRMVQKAFRDLREMPPEQRGAVMNSPQFAGQFSAQERSIMGNLLAVEPYQHNGPNPGQQYGK